MHFITNCHATLVLNDIYNKALVHTQPSIYSIATWHTYYNVYPLDLLIAR